MQKEKEKKKKVGKPLWSHVDFSLFVLMKKIRPHQYRRLQLNRRRLAAVFPALIGLVLCEPPPPLPPAPCCEELLAIQLFHLRCPAASQGAHIKRRAQQLPIFLGCCQKRNLELCLVLHVLGLQKVSSVRRHLFFLFSLHHRSVKDVFSSVAHSCLDFKRKRRHFQSTGQRRTRRSCK